MTLQAIFFANKDERLYGTIIYPGSKFRNQDVDIQAGVAVWNDKTGSYDLLTDPKLGSFYEDNKTFCRPGRTSNQQS